MTRPRRIVHRRAPGSALGSRSLKLSLPVYIHHPQSALARNAGATGESRSTEEQDDPAESRAQGPRDAGENPYVCKCRLILLRLPGEPGSVMRDGLAIPTNPHATLARAAIVHRVPLIMNLFEAGNDDR